MFKVYENKVIINVLFYNGLSFCSGPSLLFWTIDFSAQLFTDNIPALLFFIYCPASLICFQIWPQWNTELPTVDEIKPIPTKFQNFVPNKGF